MKICLPEKYDYFEGEQIFMIEIRLVETIPRDIYQNIVFPSQQHRIYLSTISYFPYSKFSRFNALVMYNMKILMLFHDFDVIDLLFHDFDVIDLSIM
jgi:hypothetical protein